MNPTLTPPIDVYEPVDYKANLCLSVSGAGGIVHGMFRSNR